ncbi:MAG: hypothetical protein KBH93_04630 [Anaerolineae bacterium]|jgi:hypothetical protein|nr:hypothetical protein [Anaerolineae bacterium]
MADEQNELRVHVNTGIMTWGDLEDMESMKSPRALRTTLERFVTVEGKSLRDLTLGQMRQVIKQIVAAMTAEGEAKN